jgi:biopolymer transport protein ExbD
MPITKARLKISDYSEQRKKKLKNQERKIQMASLSLTSMVDMFAILVIFLLTNTSTVSRWIEVGHGIQLPKAKYSDPPPRAATLQISKDAIFGDAKQLIGLKEAMQAQGSIESVRSWLAKQLKKEGYVNIVAHDRVPFGAVKRVIATCQEAGFKNVNLAVQPKAATPAKM